MEFERNDFKEPNRILKTNNELQNPLCLHINRLSPRANLIPAQKKNVYYRNKEESTFIQSLNGNYRFNYSQNDCIPDFYMQGYDDSSWDTLDVPSMWQYRGYGKVMYTNVCYPIPFNPPYVCCDNPVGYYRRKFTVDNPAEKTILHFGGVDNAFYVYVNNEFVGFSKGSRNPSEFDISRLIKPGENEIAVKVFTFSDATYLENQDYLVASGIFRDVYLLHLDKVNIWDFRVRTTLRDIMIEIDLDFHGESGYKVEITLDDQTVELDAIKKLNYTFAIKDPKLWNAEQPNLYDLTIVLTKNGKPIEVHSKPVGIMFSYVNGNKLYVNDAPVYIKGINRHEYDTKNGRTITVDLIEKELKLIKSNNINAIRCSHYTNHPAFYEIATELGLYVMDEADIETHGCEVTGDQGYLSKKEEWLPAYMDRVTRMLENNKNETCIFIWSIGNECGRGTNLEKCAKYIREFDPTREVIQIQEDEKNPQYTKFRKTGYCTLEHMESFDPDGYPFLLIEFAHSMGNSPGFLEGYIDYFYTHEHSIGGFVWEFKSHGFFQQDKKGNPYYLYGGDFEDNYHWSNFCLDGITMSDGTPKPTWYELGELLAPTYVKWNNGIQITNTNDFRSLDYLHLKWEICEDYKIIKSGEMAMPAVSPRKTAILDIDYTVENLIAGAKYRINLYFYDGNRKIASRQLELPYYVEKPGFQAEGMDCSINLENNLLNIGRDNFQITFENGLLSRYVKDNDTLINKTMHLNFYRAPTDNDGIIGFLPNFRRTVAKWDQALIKSFHFWLSDLAVKKDSDSVSVFVKGKCLPVALNVGFDMEITYRIYRNGMILTEVLGMPYGSMPEALPRIGVCFELEKDLENASWYGRGPRENYSDAKFAAPFGYYESKVNDMNVRYDVPQETGNHEDTTFVRITNKGEKGICVVGSDEFSFSYHNFTLDNLTAARHKNELVTSEKNYLYIDYKMRGLGNHSCGPDPEEPFELRPHTFKFVFALVGNIGNDKALELARSNFGIKSAKLSETYRHEKIERVSEIADCNL